MSGGKASIMEVEEEEDGKDRDGEKGTEKEKDMKMGLLDGETKRKTVIVEPSAASILDDFAF